jgi:tetratricopeptide (TPR) repeat protein
MVLVLVFSETKIFTAKLLRSRSLSGVKSLSRRASLLIGVLVGITFCYSHAEAQTARFNELMRQGEKESLSGQFEQATATYAQAIKEQPNIWTAYRMHATTLVHTGHIKEARDSINHCIALHPDGWSWYLHGLAMEDEGKLSEAVADLNRSCNLVRYSGKPHLRRAILRFLTGNFSGARDDAYVGLNYAPTWMSGYQICSVSDALSGLQSDSILNLAKYTFAKLHKGSDLRLTAQESSNIEDACELTKTTSNQLLKRLNSNQPKLTAQQVIFAKSIVYFYQQNYDAALKELASQNIGNQVNARLLRFYCLEMKGQLGRVDGDIHQLARENTKSDRVLDALDLYYFETGKRQESISEMKRFFSLDPSNDAAPYELTKIYRDLSEPGEALKYCEMALHLRPKNEELLLIKSNLLITLGRESEALKLLADILAQNPKCGQAYMMQAAIFTHQEKWSEAIESLSAAIKLNHNLVKALPARSACYAANHQDSLARKDLKELKDANPDQWQVKLY